MTKKKITANTIYILFLIAFLLQACMRFGSSPTQADTSVALSTPIAVYMTDTPVAGIVAFDTPTATGTTIIPSETSQPKVIITAVKGNLFIRRGPGLAYNPIDVLYKNSNAGVIARDKLSRWVQVNLPNSKGTGWISVQSQYSKVDGSLDDLPSFTFTDWPIPAYLQNCTEHDIYILPGETTVTSVFTRPDNLIWLYPGMYTIYDITLPDQPKLINVSIREGSNVAINTDGLGNHHKCP